MEWNSWGREMSIASSNIIYRSRKRKTVSWTFITFLPSYLGTIELII